MPISNLEWLDQDSKSSITLGWISNCFNSLYKCNSDWVSLIMTFFTKELFEILRKQRWSWLGRAVSFSTGTLGWQTMPKTTPPLPPMLSVQNSWFFGSRYEIYFLELDMCCCRLVALDFDKRWPKWTFHQKLLDYYLNPFRLLTSPFLTSFLIKWNNKLAVNWIFSIQNFEFQMINESFWYSYLELGSNWTNIRDDEAWIGWNKKQF